MGVEQGRGNLKATEFIEKELGIKGFRTVDLLSGFLMANGENLSGDFLSMDFDLKNWLLEGKIKALTKTDSCVYRDLCINKHTSCWYNSFSKQYVGNYENWVFAQPVKGWCVSSYKAIFDNLEQISEMGIAGKGAEDFSDSWGTAYNWFYLYIKLSGRNRLEIPVLTPGEMSPVLPRD